MAHLQILFNSYFFGLTLFGEEFLTDRGTQKCKIFFLLNIFKNTLNLKSSFLFEKPKFIN